MKIKKILGLVQILCLAWMMFLIIPNKAVNATSNVGLGDIGFTETRDVSTGVELEYVMGTNNSGEQKAYTVEIAKGALTPYVTYGTYVNGGEKLTSIVENAENDLNKKVVAAINGDFYDTSNGVPLGIMISNGKFVTSGTNLNSWEAIGFKADGSIIYGVPSISMVLNDGSDIQINYLNTDRKNNNTAVYMYTSDYGLTTKNTAAGTEVVLNVTNGEVKLGSTISAVVESINATNTSIPEGKIVLSTASTKLSGLTVGKNVTISIRDNKAAQGWSDVVQAIGYNEMLVENSVFKPITESDTYVHPRSAIGVKADGSIILFQVDGRQPGWSNGLTYKQIGEHLVSKGAIHVFNLDGGGSSTLNVRLPGNETSEVLNSPSDGGERSNSNALLFFANVSPDPLKAVAHLHTYPNNLVILEGAKTTIVTKATDKNYYPVNVPADLTYEVSAGLGTINNNGEFTAKMGAGTGTITVRSGNISHTLNVTVVDTITNVVADKTYLSIAPGEEVSFNLTAYKDGMPIICSNSSFTWQLSSPVLGTINNGVFKGTNTSAAGSIYISYKAFKITIPVEVGKQPKMIATFEDVAWGGTIENPGNGGTGTVSVNTDERFVKFGEKSLRIDYDLSKSTGTTSVTATIPGGTYTLEGYPTHIGMWVFGDGNGANIRMMIYANGAVQYLYYVPDIVNWTGWKYIECEIPKGLPTPISLKYAIRVMSVSGKVKSSGTLYFDNVRAVYGFRNDDILEPQVKNITPANKTTVDSKQPTVSLTVWDQPDENGVITGIKKESIKMWINNELMNNVLLTDNPDGTITINYTPSALSLLRSGPQVVKVRVEDNYGNITYKQWQFYVSGEYAGVDGVVPNKSIIYAGDIFDYYITANTYKKFEKLEATLTFNNRALEIKNITKVDSNITLNSINIATANSTGTVNLVATGMMNLTQPEDKNLIKITFGTKDGFIGNSDSAIMFKDVKVTETGYATPTPFLLPSFEVKVNYPYILSYITSTVGRDITFKVTDSEMNPVQDATFQVTGQTISLSGKTDEFGYVTFSEFKNLAESASFYIKALKGNYYSETLKVTMVKSLGTAKPNQIIVSPGVDSSTGVTISWQTNLDTTNSVVQYRKVGETTWKTVNEAETAEIHVVDAQVMKEYLAHVVTITGLTANTAYEYQVGGVVADATTMSDVLNFKTAPSGDISLLFLGDPQNTSQSGYQITKSLIDEALKQNPNLAMTLISGDMVDDVNMYAQWAALEAVLEPYFSKMITVSATGNHDVIRNYGDPFTYAIAGPRNGVEVLGANYFFEAGNVAIAVIDTETPEAYDAQADWLIDKMANTTKKFRLVLMHRSPYAANYEEPHVRDYWPSVFDEAKIDLVLSGHDHVYNSTSMYNDRRTTKGYGTMYVAGGSSGSKFYNSNNLDERYWLDYMYDEDNPVYSTISIVGDKLTLETFALSSGTSESINSFVIDKSVNRASTINVSNEIRSILPGNEHQFEATLKDKNGQDFTGTVKYILAEPVSGVTLSESGKLTVTSEFAQTVDIKVIAYYESVETVVDVKVVGQLPTETEVLDNLIVIQNDFINSIYR